MFNSTESCVTLELSLGSSDWMRMSKKETSIFLYPFLYGNSESIPSQVFIYSSLGLSEYLHPVLSHQDRVLELRGPAVVGADGGPVVLQHPHPGAALAHPRLYREGHPREHPARVRVPE